MVDEFTGRVAAVLKAAQSAPGMPSYTELAEATGISRATIARVLNGQRDITLTYLQALCTALDLTPADVVAAAHVG